MHPGITIPFPRPDASLRLFCLPYAGGSSTTYLRWPLSINSNVELITLDPPGRSRRLMERPLDRIDALVELLASEILPWLDRPYALFGHSNGALVAFELARHLTAIGKPPLAFFAAAKAAPSRIDEQDGWHQLSDPDFLTQLHKADYLSDDFVAHPELAQLFLPTLRADFALSETYRYRPAPPLPCRLAMISGASDDSLDAADRCAWAAEFAGGASWDVIPGDHLFIEDHPQQVISVVDRVINELQRGPAPAFSAL